MADSASMQSTYANRAYAQLADVGAQSDVASPIARSVASLKTLSNEDLLTLYIEIPKIVRSRLSSAQNALAAMEDY